MPPLPKDPSTRQRRNRTSTAAHLSLVHSIEMPALPTGRDWHPQTVEWWADVWASPMAPEYHSSDRHGLFVLAVLVDDFWCEPTKDLAAEIRLQRQCFGLTPIDRRRLQWEIQRGEEAEDATKKRRSTRTRKPAAAKDDPRQLLA